MNNTVQFLGFNTSNIKGVQMVDLNCEQNAAVEHIDGPLLVLAGAGSGKTRIVTTRIVNLLDKGVPAHQILAVTFTNKAAEEMRERVQSMTQSAPLICTFHSLGVKVLRQCADHLGYGKDFTIYDEDDALKLIKVCMNEAGIRDRDIKPKYFKHKISTAKNQLQSPDNIDFTDLTSEKEQLFPEIYASYQRKLEAYNALDFDDLLFVMVRLLKDCPVVLEYYQNLWRYLLIDEYQDTNEAQYSIARMLVEKSQNIFVVGDPDQSIYSWRGANIHNILSFEKDYPNAKVVRLEQNYRSHANILNAANELIRCNSDRYEKNLWSDLGDGAKITLYSGDTDRDEANFVVRKISHHRGNGNSYNETVIFYRTNAQSRVFEDALMYNRIPYVIVGGISFYQRREIKDILAYLRMVQSGADFVSFLRTINLPKRGIGDTTINKIRMAVDKSELNILDYCVKLAEGEIKADGFRFSAKQKEGLISYVNVIQHLRKVAEEESLSSLVVTTLRQSGYLDYLRGDKETYEDRRANLDELVAKAVEWEEHNEEGQLSTFLEELSLRTTLDESTSEDDRISMMTVHNGKGLEFNLTFLVGMEEDLFPHANSRGSQESLEEERRLCYVGMTRAKEYLYMTSAKTRYIWQEQRIMRQSRFLREIPEEYIEREANVSSSRFGSNW
ncbi:MAG: DNA helicase-2/ATP-dependent DNA helicase PcrA [Chlamydiales bacterium]|jgi:DNA helicase-2/ATP-dependent DNA helicase PcrA